jgi:signal transduction histidine kinase
MSLVSEPAAVDRRRILIIDGLLAIAVGLVMVAPIFIVPGPYPPGVASSGWLAAYGTLLAAPLALRRLHPQVSFVAVAVVVALAAMPFVEDAIGVMIGVVQGDVFVLLAALFFVAVTVDRRRAVAATVVALALFGAATILPVRGELGLVVEDFGSAGVLVALVVGLGFYLAIPVVVAAVAQRLRHERITSELLREEAIRAVVAGEMKAATAASNERRRLAADLHDVVAHHVNLMVVQAETGPFLGGADDAQRTFATIADTGRRALGELDRMLGVLRVDGGGEGPAMSPLPRLSDVPDLVERARLAGMPIELHAFDVPSEIDLLTGATVHRIVQECVTNIVKHSSRHTIAVVAVTAGRSTIRVTAENRADEPVATGRAGRGLDMMRSRIEALGGELETTTAGGEFRLVATLPLVGSDTTAVSA